MRLRIASLQIQKTKTLSVHIARIAFAGHSEPCSGLANNISQNTASARFKVCVLVLHLESASRLLRLLKIDGIVGSMQRVKSRWRLNGRRSRPDAACGAAALPCGATRRRPRMTAVRVGDDSE